MTDRAAEVATKIHFACSHGPHGCSPACVVETYEAAALIRAHAAEAVAAEREACAKQQDEEAKSYDEAAQHAPDGGYDRRALRRRYLECRDRATAIRARKETG